MRIREGKRNEQGGIFKDTLIEFLFEFSLEHLNVYHQE